MAANFSELIDQVRKLESNKAPAEIAYLDQLDAKFIEACKLYGVALDDNSVKAALVAFALVDPPHRTLNELSIVTCLSRHVKDN